MLDTQAIMHELSTDSEVTVRKVLGSAEILPSRPGIDPFDDTRPMYISSDSSSLQATPITATSPSIIARTRIPSWPVASSSSSYIFSLQFSQWSLHPTVDPRSLHMYSCQMK